MDKRFWAIVGVIVLIFVGFLAFRGDSADAPKNSNAKPTNHTRGEGASKVTLLEYGDFQCPACKAYYPVVEQTVTKYNKEITYQFRNFPLTSLHPNAYAASRAAEAASQQGKFWEMYHQLYENQDSWKDSRQVSAVFEQYAKQLGLNVEKFKQDYKSDAVNNAVKADMAAGQNAKADSTPTFVLNGAKIENPTSAEAFTKIIDEAIAKQKESQ
jgi:protein-disulfide isomerase